MKNFISAIADKELVQKLIDSGYGKFIRALMGEEVYTQKGRLNKSALARVLGWTAIQVQRAIEGCKQVLGEL